MKPAEKLYSALADRAGLLGRQLKKAEWLETAEMFLASFVRERRKAAVAEGAEAIYEAYPKRVGKDDALKAITAALKRHPAEYLLDKTTQFAAAVQSWPSSYRYKTDGRDTCPHPATWFNQGRFQDDPREWRRAGARSAPEHRPAPAAQTKEQADEIARDAEAMRQRYLAMPEPESGTLDHSLWVEARRNSAIATVSDAATAPVKQIENEQRFRTA